MEKIISFVIFVQIFVCLLSLSDVGGQKMPAFIQECKTAENISDEDMMKFKNDTQPKTREMKCFIACVFEKTKKTAENKLNNEGVLAHIKTLPTYSEQLEKSVVEILEECKNVQDPDRCEFAMKLKDCLMDGAKKRGIQKSFECQ